MKLSWKDFAIIFGLILVAVVASHFVFKQSVETETVDGKEINVVKNHLFKVKAA